MSNDNLERAKKEVEAQKETVLNFVNTVREVTRGLEETGIEYLTYYEVGKMDKAMDKVREAHGIVYQKGEHDEGHVYRSYHSDFVYKDHKDAYDED
jgi:hypothetical protein|tara:strand:- start:225 stop:512 length:288 start_codon:yes stop_codon:yes gene_type:complete